MSTYLFGQWNSSISNSIDKNRVNVYNKYCNSDNNQITSLPYGLPSCSKFAVIRTPPMNQWLGRGCVPDSICDKQYNTYFALSDSQSLSNNTAPGGLADPRTILDGYNNFRDYIGNGFIPDSCECSTQQQIRDRCKNEKCSWNTIKLCTNPSCDSVYTENIAFAKNNKDTKDPKDYVYGTNGFNKILDIPSDVSNAPLSENCTISYTDSPTSKSNCALYIEKWAKSCKWCKEFVAANKSNQLPPPDIDKVCNSDNDCYGDQPGRCRNGRCDGTYQLDCNICNSRLWDYVPGGWEAVADPTNPLHTIANMSYVAKYQKIPGHPTLPFCRRELGPVDDGSYDNCGGQVCAIGSQDDWEDDKNRGDTVWKNVPNNSDIAALGRDEKSCKYSRYINNTTEKLIPQLTVICQRNPQLSGQGLYDNNPEEPTKSNYQIAMNWATGYLDLSDYGIPKQKYFSDEQTKNNLLETLRCCNGLPPKPGMKISDCMPATTCPGNKFCRDIHMAIPQLPYYDSYKFGHDTQWDPATSKSPEHYLKMYCEIATKQFPKDPQLIPFCRRTMYDYAAKPVEVAIGGYRQDTQKLPLRIFDQSTINWCNWQKLTDNKVLSTLEYSLPDQEGVCDMLLGRACQKLQADGWITEDGNNSPILGIAKGGAWSETSGATHTGLTADRISQVCGCFLLGSECDAGNCSYSYCGSGAKCETAKDRTYCETLGCRWESESNMCTYPSDINREVRIGDRVLPEWTTNFNEDTFSCKNSSNNSCHTNCNYVNTYDVCWNASPSERVVPVARDTNIWNCDGGNCNGEYTCEGECTTDTMGQPNCGTNSWFSDPCVSATNADECGKKIQCKWDGGRCFTVLGKDAPNDGSDTFNEKVNSWVNWQNSYTQYANRITISGMSINNLSISSPKNIFKLCHTNCATNTYGIKPYGKDIGCTQECELLQNISNFNMGQYTGSTINMTNKAMQQCGILLNSSASDPNISREFINYMGDINNCTTNCDNSKICIDVKTGDNCNTCKSPKSHVCCISAKTVGENISENNMKCYPNDPLNATDLRTCSGFITQSDCEARGTSCKWMEEEVFLNKRIYNVIGSNKVSYICQESCPKGSIDILNLQKSCTKDCKDYTSQDDCNTCTYCTWDSTKNLCTLSNVCPPQDTNIDIYTVNKKQPTDITPESVAEIFTPEVIGAIVGGVLGLALLIGIGIFIYRKYFLKPPPVPTVPTVPTTGNLSWGNRKK